MNPMLFIALAVIAYFSVAESRAQIANYPDKPIKMMVGFSAGGGTDVIARIVAQKMSEGLGQSVLVENRPGARLRRRGPGWHFAARLGGPPVSPRPIGPRPDRNGQGQTWHHQLWIGWARDYTAHGRRVVRICDRYQDRTHRLSGRSARHQRSLGWT